MLCFRKFLMAKKSMDKNGGGGLFKFSVENFLSHSTETIVEEPFSAVFPKTAGSEKVYGKKGEGGLSKYSVEKFLTQIAETFRRGTLYSFISFGYRKCLCFRVFCHDFPSKSFCLTVPKHFVEEPFCAMFQEFSGGEKVHG